MMHEHGIDRLGWLQPAEVFDRRPTCPDCGQPYESDGDPYEPTLLDCTCSEGSDNPC